MQRTIGLKASIALGFLGVALYGCETRLPVHHYTTAFNPDLPKGRVCMVGDQGCRAMMTESPHTCLIDSGHCNATGRIQLIDPNMGVTPEPEQRLKDPITIDPK